jgi:CheY-like chemotaxis protein
MKVLVIEDNPIVQSGLVRVLEHAGFTVSAVNDAMSAFAQLERITFDVIVCDVGLPFVDGTEFYQQLAEAHPSMSHRVMFVTAMVEDPKIQAFLQRTGRPALGKPFELEELVSMVRTVADHTVKVDEPMIGVQSLDRSAAHGIPDAFAALEGSPPARLAALIDRHWASVEESERRQLAQMLLVILEPVMQGAPVTEQLRQECEDAVLGWTARQ